MAMGVMKGRFALDLQGLQQLHGAAGRQPQKGAEAAARQFEAMFLQMMVKSMRDAIPQSGLADSSQMRFYRDMFDQQLSQHLAGRGIGLADQLIAQLGADRGRLSAPDSLIAGIPAATSPPNVAGAGHASVALQPAGRDIGKAAGGGGDFINRLAGPAHVAARETGLPAELIVAQAVLETGWGRHEIVTDSGANSHNLFGVKAGDHWQGPTTDVATHEYRDGRRQAVTEPFRVYDSYTEAFRDYARLLGENPRYREVMAAPDAESAARALQEAGYATDPDYADKLAALMMQLDGQVGGRRLASAK